MFSKLLAWLSDLSPHRLLLLAGGVMLLMFVTIYFFLSKWTEEKEAEQVEEVPAPIVAMRTVVTAKTDIPPLTIIKEEMLQTKEIPEDTAPSDAITNPAKVVNTSSKTAIFKDDVITERKLFSDLGQLTFVGSIPPDCRAVSINVNEVTSVDGFAKPGDRVDLLLVETNEKQSATTNILLQDVLLLSINKNMSKVHSAETKSDGTVTTEAVENPSTATFALRPDEVLKLISASKLGEIYLMLRPLHPTEQYSADSGYTIRSVTAPSSNSAASTQNLPPIPATTNLPPIPDFSSSSQRNGIHIDDENKIEIIQGDKIVQGK